MIKTLIRRLLCEHAWVERKRIRTPDRLLDMGWMSVTEECLRCGKMRYHWEPHP